MFKLVFELKFLKKVGFSTMHLKIKYLEDL